LAEADEFSPGGLEVIAETTTWAEAAIAVVAVAFVFLIAIVAVWQVGKTWRTRMKVRGPSPRPAEDVRGRQSDTPETRDEALAELAELRQRATELERLLKQAD
jgi:flagellar biosynthesis/type III secretory pathway M-ring protein FliF/YscJ